jgi:glycosyltransferase involved in cell wall biosynthesis
VGLILKFIKKAKLIYNVHELETKKLGWGIYRQLLSRLFEKFFINFVDRMIVVSPEIARWYENAFNIKATIILNAVCTQRQTKHHNFLNVRFHLPSDSVIFVYVGSLSAGRGIDLLIEVFGQLNSLDKVVIFIGYGDYQDKIVEAQRNYKNIFYHPALASHDISKFISAAHFGLALIENLCLSYYYSLPTKIFDYISAGIPVICSSMLEISRLVDTHEIGIIIDELTVDRVREVIEKVDKNTSRKYAENVLKVQSFYTWENEEKKLLQIYNSLT